VVIVVDPGMVASRAALFPAARIHDHWAMYVGDR
jgi:hypothetical protein